MIAMLLLQSGTTRLVPLCRFKLLDAQALLIATSGLCDDED